MHVQLQGFICFGLIFIVCSTAFSQPTDSSSTDSLILPTKLSGSYDAEKGTYYYRYLDKDNSRQEHVYEVKKFNGNYGIVQYNFIHTGDYRHFGTRYGLLDTLGNVLIPCIYAKLETLCCSALKKTNCSATLYGFEKNDSLGLINAANQQLISLPKYTKNADLESIRTNNHIWSLCDDLINVRQNDRCGIFSAKDKQMVVPAIYDEIRLVGKFPLLLSNGKMALYSREHNVVVNGITQVAWIEDCSALLFRDTSNLLFLCTDPVDPIKTSIAHLTRDGIMEYYDGYFATREQEKVGVLDSKGNVLIPFLYDDIVFMSVSESVLLRKGDRWAISNLKHELQSDFVFLDIDQQNRSTYETFLAFSKADTSARLYEETQAHLDTVASWWIRDGLLLWMHTNFDAVELLPELDKKILIDYERFFCLKMDDGYHIAYTDRSKNDAIVVDSLSWDRIYLIPMHYRSSPRPSYKIGVRKGDLYTYYNPLKPPKKIKMYTQLVYDPTIFSYNVNGYERNPFGIVKHGHTYFEVIKWKPFSNRPDKISWKRW